MHAGGKSRGGFGLLLQKFWVGVYFQGRAYLFCVLLHFKVFEKFFENFLLKGVLFYTPFTLYLMSIYCINVHCQRGRTVAEIVKQWGDEKYQLKKVFFTFSFSFVFIVFIFVKSYIWDSVDSNTFRIHHQIVSLIVKGPKICFKFENKSWKIRKTFLSIQTCYEDEILAARPIGSSLSSYSIPVSSYRRRKSVRPVRLLTIFKDGSNRQTLFVFCAWGI